MDVIFSQEEGIVYVRALMSEILELFQSQPYAHEVEFEHMGAMYTLTWPEYAEVMMNMDGLSQVE